MNNQLGVFIGQSMTRLVRGRTKYKVHMTYPSASEDPAAMQWVQDYRERELTELEKLYREFCEEAFKKIISHPSMQGENHPHQIIFPDFTYEIIERRFPVV